MKNDERIKEKLRKLLELARQGVGGEKDNAQSILVKLLKKHGIQLDDLDPECSTVEPHEFSIKDEMDRDLLHQVIYAVLQTSSVQVRIERGNSKKVCIKITKAQKLEIDLAFGVYREAFRNEQRKLFLAFINKNKLFGPGLEKEDAERAPKRSPLSKEDAAAILAMMGAIKTTHIHKALPSTVENSNEP
jgi:hypothetical protein